MKEHKEVTSTTPSTLGAFSRNSATTLVNCGENHIFSPQLLRNKSATCGRTTQENRHSLALHLAFRLSQELKTKSQRQNVFCISNSQSKATPQVQAGE
jgi:hypothetical protein